MRLAIDLGRWRESAIFERGFDFLGIIINICVGQKYIPGIKNNVCVEPKSFYFSQNFRSNTVSHLNVTGISLLGGCKALPFRNFPKSMIDTSCAT